MGYLKGHLIWDDGSEEQMESLLNNMTADVERILKRYFSLYSAVGEEGQEILRNTDEILEDIGKLIVLDKSTLGSYMTFAGYSITMTPEGVKWKMYEI